MIFIVLGGLVLKIWPLLGGLSFRDSLFAPTPPIFRIAATQKRNGVEISNSQNFLVSMISTSILNKKKIHDIGCTPLFELGCSSYTAKKIPFQVCFSFFFFFFFLMHAYTNIWVASLGDVTTSPWDYIDCQDIVWLRSSRYLLKMMGKMQYRSKAV